jgi:23S rRNA maturation mini-RNase III
MTSDANRISANSSVITIGAMIPRLWKKILRIERRANNSNKKRKMVICFLMIYSLAN